jgi:glycosyltransferase involved in cell wall biosynthesis
LPLELNLHNTKQSKYCLSVVIPTLGGDSLRSTIEHLNKGTVFPTEILVCIPEEDSFRAEHLSYTNVRVVKTDCRGQVAQRAIGLKLAINEYVLQMDDDIQLESETIRLLLTNLEELGKKNVVGPAYYDLYTKQPIHSVENGIKGIFKSIFYLVFCGAKWGVRRMGKFTSAGIGFGIDPTRVQGKCISVEWLPGGCVLSYKEDLITENFFPNKGKAYCEDFIHSYLRSVKGIQHWVVPEAECLISFPEAVASRDEKLASVKARRYFVDISRRSLIRLKMYEFFSWIVSIIKQ